MTRSNHILEMTRTGIRRVVACLGCGALAAGLTLSAGAAVAAPAPSPSATALTPAQAAVLGVDDVRRHEYWLTDYKIVDAWKESTGMGVTVAVIDTGVDGTHPDLTDNVLEGYDASGEGAPNGWQGLGTEPMHGTEVASLIAGHGHDVPGVPKIEGQPGKPAGVIGVAPDAKILPISLNMVSTAQKSIDEQIPAAVRYAVDQGAQVINLSIGSNKTTWPKSWDDAFAYAEEKGVLVVASAGNRGSGISQVGAPATIPGVLTVGGVDRQRQVSRGSSTQGISLAITAPSTEMIAAAPGNKYMIWSGSSASAPLVSGVAALIKSKYPNLTASQIIQRIISSADDTGAEGRDPVYGFGIINPLMALDPATDQKADENPLGSLKSWIAVHRRQEIPAPTPADASETPVHEEGETLVKAKVPEPSRPVEDTGLLPPLILGALFVALGLLTARSVYKLHRLQVHVRDVVPHPHTTRSRASQRARSVSSPQVSASKSPAVKNITPLVEAPASVKVPYDAQGEAPRRQGTAATSIATVAAAVAGADAAAVLPTAPIKQEGAAAPKKPALGQSTAAEDKALASQPEGTPERQIEKPQEQKQQSQKQPVQKQETAQQPQKSPHTVEKEKQKPQAVSSAKQASLAERISAPPAALGSQSGPTVASAAEQPSQTPPKTSSSDVSPSSEPQARKHRPHPTSRSRAGHAGHIPHAPRKPRVPRTVARPAANLHRQVPTSGTPDIPQTDGSLTAAPQVASAAPSSQTRPGTRASGVPSGKRQTPKKHKKHLQKPRPHGSPRVPSSLPDAPAVGIPEPSSAEGKSPAAGQSGEGKK